MADYVIGDVQGCYDPLMRLLSHINYADHDRLWFAGDLVNRGPDSLAVLRFIHKLATPARIALGNHDLHLLSHLFTKAPWQGADDTIDQILKAQDALELGHWLRKQSILIYEPALELAVCHAGILPLWTLEEALNYARELEAALRHEDFHLFFNNLYGNEPRQCPDSSEGFERLRFICNVFTRMRLVDSKGCLNLDYKGSLEKAPDHLYPWFDWPERKKLQADLVFGHWAALKGQCPVPRIHAIDTACVWGGKLTALRVDDKKRFEVSCA